MTPACSAWRDDDTATSMLQASSTGMLKGYREVLNDAYYYVTRGNNKCEVTTCVRKNVNMHGWGCTPGGDLKGSISDHFNQEKSFIQRSSMFM